MAIRSVLKLTCKQMSPFCCPAGEGPPVGKEKVGTQLVVCAMLFPVVQHTRPDFTTSHIMLKINITHIFYLGHSFCLKKGEVFGTVLWKILCLDGWLFQSDE